MSLFKLMSTFQQKYSPLGTEEDRDSSSEWHGSSTKDLKEDPHSIFNKRTALAVGYVSVNLIWTLALLVTTTILLTRRGPDLSPEWHETDIG